MKVILALKVYIYLLKALILQNHTDKKNYVRSQISLLWKLLKK